jgi:pimeloyl-ACP methyl ester carboxylesterase
MKLEVTPSLARVDEVLTVRVSGCQPSKTVRLIAQMGEGDWEWTSQSNFIADSEGTVDVSKAVSVSGSYEGQDPMGLIWSMELCERGKEKWRSGHFERVAGEVRVKRTFQAECAGKRSEPVISTAYYARAPVTYSAIREQGVVASMFHRPGVRRPGIIVLSGSGGGMDGSMAALLAAHGYTTIALAYFGIDGLPKELRQIPREYFETAINWFRSHGDVLPESIGAAGSSRGGELALLLGSRFPEIRAVVSYVGSGLVLGAVTQTRSIVQLPAWMWRGEPIEPLSAEEMKPEFLESDGRHLWALERLKDKQAAESLDPGREHQGTGTFDLRRRGCALAFDSIFGSSNRTAQAEQVPVSLRASRLSWGGTQHLASFPRDNLQPRLSSGYQTALSTRRKSAGQRARVR